MKIFMKTQERQLEEISSALFEGYIATEDLRKAGKNLQLAIEEAAIEIFGKENQKDMMIEEMAELSKELLKERRGSVNHSAILEEMADVEISLDQMKMIYGSCEKIKEKKIIRLEDKIERKKKGVENERLNRAK